MCANIKLLVFFAVLLLLSSVCTLGLQLFAPVRVGIDTLNFLFCLRRRTTVGKLSLLFGWPTMVAAAILLTVLSSGLNAQSKQADGAPSASQVQIRTTAISAGSVTISVTIPGTPDKFVAHLNGKDVTSAFTGAQCDGGTCKTAVLTQADGLNTRKNVLAVDSGHGLTSRLRFSTNVLPSSVSVSNARSVTAGVMAMPKAQTVGSGYQTALPPTVAFTTLTPGGWEQGASKWISINGTGYPATAPPGNCNGSIFLAIVLDRQTLVEQTSAPESSPMCLANSAALKTYLSSLTNNDLVIVGSIAGQSPDSGLDLTPIGGSVFGGQAGSGQLYPAQIFAVGAPGATTGTAYQGYFANISGYENIPEFGQGSLQEDAYGNYNFYSSDVIEYAVSPNDPGVLNSSATGQSAVSISIPNAPTGNAQWYVYTSPQGQINGFWLLTLSRNNLHTYPYGCPQGPLSPDGSVQYIPSCGTFYNTGSSDPSTSTQALKALAAAISGTNSWQMTFLVSVGTPVFGGSNNSIWNVGGMGGSANLPASVPSNGFYEFSQALLALGGTPNLIQSLIQPGSTYTFVGSPGVGGPLAGGAVESTSALAAQGQTGFVHGIMQRNLNGLYQPHQTNQEPASVYAVKGSFKSPEFKLTEAILQQPVDWPSSSTTTVIGAACAPNCLYANSIVGQVAAYKLLSFVLLNDFYMQGSAPNPHSDDLHYFFTGSYNTSISYHTYDPQSFNSPTMSQSNTPYACSSIQSIVDQYGNSTKECTITSFVTDGSTLVFTDNDFYAVATQLHYEIQYLTNTLQFLTTGSNNLKSVIASGSANVGLALTGAAANVLGSDLVAPPPQTIVTTSWQSIVQLIAGSSSILSLVPGLDAITPALNLVAKLAGGANSLIGGSMTISADAGGITKTATSKSLPSAFSTFSDTISDLANGGLQDQLAGGFDTMSDAVTSDWGRLSTIGPMTANPSNLVFFAPTQASQQVAIRAVSLAASRNFYLALMPAMGYSVDYYPGVQGWVNPPSGNANIPDMGVYSDAADWHTCSAFYLNPQTNSTSTFTGLGSPTANSFVFYPSVAGGSNPFGMDEAGNGTTSVDMYIIGGKVSYKGTNSTAIGLPSSDLTSYLFTNAGLNLPVDQFVTPNGPMQSSFGNMSSTSNRAGADVGKICPAQSYPQAEVGATLGGTQTSTNTTTTLSAATTNILGDDLPVSATVMSGITPVATGSVYFTVDGGGSVSANLNPQGVASTAIPTVLLTRGTHQIVALYSRVDPYGASTSAAVATNVYTTAPDMNLSASANSVNVSYGSTSSPITLQLTSLAGLAGTVNLTCSGLPVGMTCGFNPAQVTLTANGQSSASLTISGGTAAKSSLWAPGIGLLLLPISLVSLSRVRKGARQLGGIICLLVLSLVGISCLSGCSGGSSPSSNTFQEIGNKTVIISASSGTISRTIPIQVNIQ